MIVIAYASDEVGIITNRPIQTSIDIKSRASLKQIRGLSRNLSD